MEGVGDRLGDGGGDLDAAAGLVVGDLEAEGVEHLALEFGWGLVEGVGQVGDPREELSRVLGGPRIGRGGGEVR